MQFSLRTLLILMAVICVYLGILNAPQFIALPIYCAIACVAPAYWITGVIYARDGQRAFFIGGLAAGAVPFIVLSFFGLVAIVDGPWRWSRGFGRYEWGETQLINMLTSLVIFAPLGIAFLGGWVASLTYRSLRPPESQNQ